MMRATFVILLVLTLAACGSDDGLRFVDNVHSWSTEGASPTGTIFSDFLPALNNCESSNGSTVAGGFAGHCDWRLPAIDELSSLTVMPYPCTTDPCIAPIFGPTQTSYVRAVRTDS